MEADQTIPPEDALNRYGNAIFKYCLSILCDFHESQDAMQETFLKAHRAYGTLRAKETYEAWLYKIAYNTCLNMLRGKRRLFPAARPFREAETEPAYQMEAFFPDPALLAALGTLPPADRALFYSRAVEGMDYAELEARFNIRAATLRKRYERAKNKLRANLTAVGYPERSNI